MSKLATVSLCALLVGPTLKAQCVSSSLFVGGQVSPAFPPLEPFVTPALYVDFAHPATATISATRADVSIVGANPFIVQFLAVRPSGTTYTILAKSGSFAVNPPGSLIPSTVITQSLELNPPLTFSRGDVLGVISSAPLAVTYADRPGGYEVYSVSTFNANVGDALSQRLGFVDRYTIAAAVQGQVACAQVPPAELLLPAVGDVIGVAHFVTRLDAAVHFPGIVTQPSVIVILLDRLSNPDSAHILGGAFNFDGSGSFHADSIATSLGISPPFFGPMILQFPATSQEGRGGKTIFATASATIVAPNACNGGETGSVIQAVGCSGIGRAIELHFHVPPDHRANLGIVSAHLESCGVAVPATAVTVNGSLVQMPAQSIQLNNITALDSPLPSLAAAIDAVVTIEVTDNASRIAAYLSVLDNRSQDSVVITGIPIK